MNNLEMTIKTEDQIKEQAKKLANHYNASNCELMDRPIEVHELYKEDAEGVIWELVEVIPNNSKSCPKVHNSATAVYRVFEGSLGYDL